MIEWNLFWRIFSIVFLVTAIVVAFVIILEKRSPYKTIAWILVLVLLPVVGIIFYLFFGQEYRKRKLFSRKGIKSLTELRKLSSKQLREIEHSILKQNADITEKEHIIRLLLNNSDALLTTGNKLKILKNGKETFDAILDAIQQAQHHIHLEYYIFADDKIGHKFKEALIEKRKQGVEVRIIVDDVGSWSLSNKFINEFKQNEIEIYSFMEVRFPRLTSKMNYRNHRKIAIIDGEIGFTGGINIADRYSEGFKKIPFWRDTHLQITGDAVASLQVIFTADWFFVINENLSGSCYFPHLSESLGTPVQISTSGPDSDWKSIEQAFFSAITTAKKSIYLTTPYFMPTKQIMSALEIAALSNVDVRIIIPKISDVVTPKWSSFSFVEKLLEAGIRVYFYQKGFTHSKYLLVDDIFSTVGTTNLDFRSLETNFEVNAFIYEKSFTMALKELFLDDIKNSQEIQLKEWLLRPWHYKLRESLAHIISPLL